jgi:hypothetical protein
MTEVVKTLKRNKDEHDLNQYAAKNVVSSIPKCHIVSRCHGCRQTVSRDLVNFQGGYGEMVRCAGELYEKSFCLFDSIPVIVVPIYF